MRWGQLLLCGWPGLSRLWLRGHGPSLLIAVGFSILLNLALVSTFLWPALLGEAFPALAWPVIGLIWLGSLLVSLRMTPSWSKPPQMAAVAERDQFATQITENHEEVNKQPESAESDSGDFEAADGDEAAVDESNTTLQRTLFNQAQTEYLKGHWDEAEMLLSRQIDSDERDIESRLLLATLFRRIGNLDDATHELKQLKRFDDAVHWQFEIEREHQLIDRERQSDLSVHELETQDKRVEDNERTPNAHDDTLIHQDSSNNYEQQPDEQQPDEINLAESTKAWLC